MLGAYHLLLIHVVVSPEAALSKPEIEHIYSMARAQEGAATGMRRYGAGGWGK